MPDAEERHGEKIYQEGSIEVRTSLRDQGAHSVYVGDRFFLFQRGILEVYARRTPTEELERRLHYFRDDLPGALRDVNVTPTEFALYLSRARAKELENEISYHLNQTRETSP